MDAATTRPALLIDVDGPLNPYRAPRIPAPAGYTTHVMNPNDWDARHYQPLRVRLNPDHGAALLALPFDLVWATTWGGDEANYWLSPVLGLPDLPEVPWAELHAVRDDGTYYKTHDVVRWAAGRPFAWVDDEITDRDVDYVNRHHAGPSLLHRIDPAIGLTDADFETLAKWAAVHTPQGDTVTTPADVTLHRVIVRTPVTYVATSPTTGYNVGAPTEGSFDPATVRVTPAPEVRPGDVVLGTVQPRYEQSLARLPLDRAHWVSYFTGDPQVQEGGARPWDPSHCDLCAHNGELRGISVGDGWVSVDGCTLYGPDSLLLVVPRELLAEAA
jgi:hypothetical protein